MQILSAKAAGMISQQIVITVMAGIWYHQLSSAPSLHLKISILR